MQELRSLVFVEQPRTQEDRQLRMRVAELQGVVESTRIAWEMRRRTVESAAREMRAIPAPPAPRLLPVPPLPPAP